jgi:hypothetical protein
MLQDQTVELSAITDTLVSECGYSVFGMRRDAGTDVIIREGR